MYFDLTDPFESPWSSSEPPALGNITRGDTGIVTAAVANKIINDAVAGNRFVDEAITSYLSAINQTSAGNGNDAGYADYAGDDINASNVEVDGIDHIINEHGANNHDAINHDAINHGAINHGAINHGFINHAAVVGKRWLSKVCGWYMQVSKICSPVCGIIPRDLKNRAFALVYGAATSVSAKAAQLFAKTAQWLTTTAQALAPTYSPVLWFPIPMLSPAPMLSLAPVAPPSMTTVFLRALGMAKPPQPPAPAPLVKVFRYALGSMTPPQFPASTPMWKLILYLLELKTPPQPVPSPSFWRNWFFPPQPAADTTTASAIIVVTTVVMATAAYWGLRTAVCKLAHSGVCWLSTAASTIGSWFRRPRQQDVESEQPQQGDDESEDTESEQPQPANWASVVKWSAVLSAGAVAYGLGRPIHPWPLHQVLGIHPPTPDYFAVRWWLGLIVAWCAADTAATHFVCRSLNVLFCGSACRSIDHKGLSDKATIAADKQAKAMDRPVVHVNNNMGFFNVERTGFSVAMMPQPKH